MSYFISIADRSEVEYSRCGSSSKETPLPQSTRRTCASSNSRAGFTFVELLVAVTILSILVAIALPAYRVYLLRGKVAESLIFLGDAKSSVNEFYSRWGRMPADNHEAGLRAPEELRGNYLRNVSVSDGTMVAAMDLGFDDDHQPIERTLTFRPWVSAKSPGSPIIWACGENVPDLPDDYHSSGDVAESPVDSTWLPSVCRN